MASRLNMYLTYETLFENKTNNSMMEIVNIYYESDFIATVKLPEDIADKDFYLDFYTSGTRPVCCYKRGGILSPNLINDGDEYKVIFRDHRLQPGNLIVKFSYLSDDGLTLATRFNLPYKLTRNKSDVVPLPEINIVGSIDLPDVPDVPDVVEDFTPIVTPKSGSITTDNIKTMVLTFPSPISNFDGENVRLTKPFGSVWYLHAAEGIISEDKKTMTIKWDFAPTIGLTYTLELPTGCIVLENGAKNKETKIDYTII